MPVPSTILSTSPGKYQALWKVEGFDFDQQENALKLLAITFGGDSACTDRNRVLRVPGFLNRKYDPAHPVSVEYPGDSIYLPEDFRLDDALLNTVCPFRGTARTYAAAKSTHSEQDWAWAVQQLSLGEDAANLTLELASRRSDKSNPLYYAQRTIDIASARLMLLNGAAIEDVVVMLEHRRSAEVPSGPLLLQSAGDCDHSATNDWPHKVCFISPPKGEPQCHCLKSSKPVRSALRFGSLTQPPLRSISMPLSSLLVLTMLSSKLSPMSSVKTATSRTS